MLWYDVPQTDGKGEAAMAALIARLRASCPKPEAITAGNATDDALALIAAQWVDKIGSALGDRAMLPILRWDAALDGCCIALTSRQWLNTRGRNRQAGADVEIDNAGADAAAFLARLRPSGDANGKTENPRYVDSGGNVPLDAGLFNRSERSDDWAKPRWMRRGCRP